MEAIGLNVYFLLNTGDGTTLKRADIIEDVKENQLRS